MRQISFFAALSALVLFVGCVPPEAENETGDSAAASASVKETKSAKAPVNMSTVDQDLVNKMIARVKEFDGKLELKDGALIAIDLMDKPATQDDVKLIAQMSDLKKLTLWGQNIDNESVKLLSVLPKLENLTFMKTAIDDEGLAILPEFKALKALNLRGCDKITDAGMVHVAKIPNLENLALLYTLINDEGIVNLQDLKLRALDVRGLTTLTGTSLDVMVKMTTLESLKLRNNMMFMDFNIGVLGALKNLKSLSLEDLQITEEGLKFVGELPNLQELVLMRMNFFNLDVLAGMTGLKRLTLRDMPINSENVEFLKNLTNLEQLIMDECSIDDKGIEYLAGMDKLNLLSIWHNSITSAGLKTIAALPSLKTLTITDIPTISDEGIIALSESKTLELLKMGNNGKAVGEDGKPLVSDKSLEALQNCKSLKEIVANLCPSLTDEAKAAFRKARPDCKLTEQANY